MARGAASGCVSLVSGCDGPGHVPDVALDKVLKGNVADAVGVGCGLYSRSGKGGASKGESKSDVSRLHFGGLIE